MGHLGVPELAIIFLIVVVLFGARRLPELGSGLGKAIRSFKDALATPDPKELESGRSGESAKSEAKHDEARR